MIKGNQRHLTLSIGLLALGGVNGCNQHTLLDTQPVAAEEEVVPVNFSLDRDVDVLFVIDNSGSMAEEQARLAANFANFVDILEADDVNANYRIAVVTTDMHDALCNNTSTGATTVGANDGEMRLLSCLDRPLEFDGANSPIFKAACSDHCSHAGFETLPSKIDTDGDSIVDGDAVPRQWIERINGKTNLPQGISTTQAFQCLAPQGTRGCGIEAPLEAMKRALDRTKDKSSPNYGFLRPNAQLAIIYVTDEADCSRNTSSGVNIFAADSWFTRKGNADVYYQGSAACFRAGVLCTGGENGIKFDDCIPVDRDGEGKEIDDDEQAQKKAALHPISRYIDYLEKFREQKDSENTGRLSVSLIGGADPSSSVETIDYYPAQAGSSQETDFGIAPGCASPPDTSISNEPGTAVPPVRLKAVVDAFRPEPDSQQIFSICKESFADPLLNIANKIRDNIKPFCLDVCAEDQDPQAGGVQPQCNVWTKESESAEQETVPECKRDSKGFYKIDSDGQFTMPNDAADICYAIFGDTDGKQTEDPIDQTHESCIELQSNLEVRVQIRPESSRPQHAQLQVACKASGTPKEDCPALDANQ